MSATTPQEPHLIQLPTELLFHLLNILYEDWFQDDLLSPGGFEYLSHRLVLPNTPWNALSWVCKHLRTVVRSHRIFVTTLRQDLTENALNSRLGHASISVFYSDIDNWTGVRYPTLLPGTSFDIVSAARAALGILPDANSVHIDSVISFQTTSPVEQKSQLLSDFIATLATTQAENLQDLFLRSRRASTPYAESLVLASANQLWTARPDQFPLLERLQLYNIPCTSVPTFPPTTLVSLALDDCAFRHGMSSFLNMLSRLPRLRKLFLSRLSCHSSGFAFEKHEPRSVRLPNLQSLSLTDHIPALENMLYHLDFPLTADVELLSVVSSVDEELNGSDANFRALALELQARLDGTFIDELALHIRRRHPSFHVQAASAGTRRLHAEFGWTNENCDGMGIFIGELRALHGVTSLAIGPVMDLGEPVYGQDRAGFLHGVLTHFPNVKELKVQGEISRFVWNLLMPANKLFPHLRELVISDVASYFSLGFGQRDGLKIAFVGCPGLMEDSLFVTMCDVLSSRMTFDCSKIREPSTLIIEGLSDEDQPDDDDWGSDEEGSDEDSDVEMEDA